MPTKPSGSDRQSRSQVVRAQVELRELMLSGRLAPGDRVTELLAVKHLGVSRTPVRHALARLEEEGFLTAYETGGYVVRGFTLRDVRHAISVRGAVEGVAARAAAEQKYRRSALVDLRDCVGSLDSVLVTKKLGMHEFEDYLRLNERFHSEIIRLASSDVITRMMNKVLALPFAAPSALVATHATLPVSHDILRLSQRHHRAIAAAIEAGSADEADRLMREHAQVAIKNLEFAVRSFEVFKQLPGAKLIQIQPRKRSHG